MRVLGYFVWVLVPLAVYITYSQLGLPHMTWNYTYVEKATFGSSSHRVFLRCTYIGPYGEFTIRPDDGRCPLIRFFKDRS